MLLSLIHLGLMSCNGHTPFNSLSHVTKPKNVCVAQSKLKGVLFSGCVYACVGGRGGGGGL